MASRTRSVTANVAGEFFVDSSCIDCDACRWIAPQTFDRLDEQSRVFRQPTDAAERAAAFRALIACPTGSIGADSKSEIELARHAFPRVVDGPVHECGWHSRDSFGAASYFVQRSSERGGNVLIDSPRFSESLVRRLEELGGVAWMLLTHADDVADHERFAKRFGCKRVIHTDDVDEGTRDVELIVEGEREQRLDDDWLALPTPGHTRGSMCFLHQDTHLFTGDHLAWSASRGHLYAFRDACWFDWRTQIASMERVARHEFTWVLPGHGRRAHFDRDAMRAQMQRCIAWMRQR